MKTIATLAALTAFAFLGACASTQNTAAPGAVGAKKEACCGKCNSTCSKDKSADSKAAAPGAVGEKKSGCCAGKTEASKTAAPGAVSGKSDCSAKSSCASKCPASKG